MDLLGPDVRLYWDQAVYKKPETPREFPWHQDTGYVFTEPQDYLTLLGSARQRERRERLSLGRTERAPSGNGSPP